MPLRPLTEADLALVLTWRNAPAVRKNMYTQHEISEYEHRAWFAEVQKNPESLWFIYEDQDTEPRGVVYFSPYRPSSGNSFWGFYAGINAQPGTGTQMEFESLDKAFLELGLQKLNCEVLATNKKVINLHKKHGFVEEGLFRGFHFDGEQYINVVRLGIFPGEWLEKRDEIRTRLTKRDKNPITIGRS